jgi:hypothetical protein
MYITHVAVAACVSTTCWTAQDPHALTCDGLVHLNPAADGAAPQWQVAPAGAKAAAFTRGA